MDEIKTKRRPTVTVGLDSDLYEKLSAIAAHERRSLADTCRLLLVSGLFRYKQRGRLLDQEAEASEKGELLFSRLWSALPLPLRRLAPICFRSCGPPSIPRTDRRRPAGPIPAGLAS